MKQATLFLISVTTFLMWVGTVYGQNKPVYLDDIILSGEKGYREGYDYYYGANGKEKDIDKAFKLFLSSAEQGYAPACNQVGFMLEMGRGTGKNDAEALKYYLKAAEKGDMYGQYNAGNLRRRADYLRIFVNNAG